MYKHVFMSDYFDGKKDPRTNIMVTQKKCLDEFGWVESDCQGRGRYHGSKDIYISSIKEILILSRKLNALLCRWVNVLPTEPIFIEKINKK